MKIKMNQKGFTLIELLIVIAIIAILAAIAIPQFSAYRQRAVRAAMVSDARNTATAEEAYFADNQTYIIATAAAGASTTLGTQTVNMSKGNALAVAAGAGGIGTTYSITITNAGAGGTGTVVMTGPGGTCTNPDGASC